MLEKGNSKKKKKKDKRRLYRKALKFYLAGFEFYEDNPDYQGDSEIKELIPRIKIVSQDFSELNPKDLEKILKEIAQDGISDLWNSIGHQMESEKTIEYLIKESL